MKRKNKQKNVNEWKTVIHKQKNKQNLLKEKTKQNVKSTKKSKEKVDLFLQRRGKKKVFICIKKKSKRKNPTEKKIVK